MANKKESKKEDSNKKEDSGKKEKPLAKKRTTGVSLKSKEKSDNKDIEKKKAVSKTKSAAEKVEEKKEEKKKISSDGSYFEAVGRRKTSTAVVRIFVKGKKEFLINDKPYDQYFTLFEHQELCLAPLKKMKCFDSFKITVKVKGGGINSQMEAVRHGISRALVLFNSDFKKKLRRAGYLTRDPRQRERKKPGLKRARRAPQWKKR